MGRVSDPRMGVCGPRGSRVVQSKKRLEDNNEFVIVSFWRHFNVVDYRHACVDEEQGEGGQAGRENDA